MKVINIITLLSIIFVATPVLAGKKQGCNLGAGPESSRGPRLEQMQLMLDLTPEQREHISKILKSSHTQMAPLRAQARVNREEMDKIEQADSFDEARALELADRQADNRVSMMALKHEMRQQIDAVLTPQQLGKKNQIRELRQQQRSLHYDVRMGTQTNGVTNE